MELVGFKTAQQSVHLTGGILRHFRAFSTPEQNPALEVLSTPAHPQVTQAVRHPVIFLRPRSGSDSENIIELICSRMFFSDFVVRNPSYIKQKGKTIELADLIIPFGPTLLTFQVKSKFQLKRASEKSAVDFQRLSDAIDDGVNQIKTIKRALDNDWLRGIETAKGYKIDVNPSDVKEVVGVVILDLIGEEALPREERTQLFASFIERNGLPIHVFLPGEFFDISKELDTLTDFLEFLHITQDLYKRSLITIPPATMDLLAFHKMYPDDLENAITAGVNILLEEGLWEAYQTKHTDAIAKRDLLNEPSYLIDGVIDYLHSSVGYEALRKPEQLLEFSGQGTIDSYLAITREIATLSRLERRSLGEKLIRCLELAMEKEEAFFALVIEPKKSGYLVYSMSGHRSSRQVRLQTLAAMLYCHLDLEKVIAIATEPMSGEGRSYDVLGFSGVKFENHQDLADAAKGFFGELHKVTGSEYTEGEDPHNFSQEATGDAERFANDGACVWLGNSWPGWLPRRLSSRLLGASLAFSLDSKRIISPINLPQGGIST